MGTFAVGIDLGTTNSCVGIYRNGKVEIIQNEQNTYVIPSCVTFTDDGVLTGYEATNDAHKYEGNTIFEFKRLMGQRFNDEKVQNVTSNLPYRVIDDNDLLKIQVDYKGKPVFYFPEEISAFIIDKLKDLAQCYLGSDVIKVVVTVPAYFNEYQREATKIAATLAGFKTENVRLISEPTAAALAFSQQNPKRYSRNILVYDFGGGTFDVSVVTIYQGRCVVKATKGDLHLGGADIDLNLVNWVKENFKQQYGEDIAESEATLRRLKNSCEKIKRKLSGNKLTVEIELNNLSGKDYLSTISRHQFEEINKIIFERTLDITKDCLQNSGFTTEDIDEVVLVGGSSRIPKVQKMLQEYFGTHKLNKGVNPDEAVAFGAAIHAVSFSGDHSEVEDVIGLSLGIEVVGGLSSVVIPCNSPIPTKITKPYTTVFDNQESVRILVFQGEEKLILNNFELGRFTLTGLTKAPAGTITIQVCFEIDNDGILKVTATEDKADNEGEIMIDVNRKGLTPEEIEKKKAEMLEHRKNEFKRIQFLTTKNELEDLCLRATNAAADIDEIDTRQVLLNKCDEICKWLESISLDDQSDIEHKKKDLEEVCNASGIILENN